MHEVKAFIRPELVDRVVQELHAVHDLPGLTTSTVRGHGRRHGGPSDDTEYGDVTMVKMELVVPDELLQPVLDTIRRTATTGRSGDGKIVVLPVESATKIRIGNPG